MGERRSRSDTLVRIVDEKLAEEVESGGGGGLVLRAVAAARVEPLLKSILMSDESEGSANGLALNLKARKLTDPVARADCTRASESRSAIGYL
jgi:hypothetical protein